MAGQIHYRKGYKYQLAREFHYQLPKSFRPQTRVVTEFLLLQTNGRLTILSGYSWDGPSGPLRDSTPRMKASLVHDALYQLLRHDLLPRVCRVQSDDIFREILVEDGTWRISAWLYCKGLKIFGGKAASRQSIKKVYIAG